MKYWLVISLTLLGLFSILIFIFNSITGNVLNGETPPIVEIEVENKTQETTLGTYCWQDKCVEKAGPEEILKGKEPIIVKAGDSIKLNMNYETPPNKFRLIQINNSKKTDVSINNGIFKAPIAKGVYFFYME
ncbi:hypothetical protein [Bacillus sp. 2205SS5-2]|uniref:hypothetical protein n=1 Tax=Bacillus sp. 2205SS5-2 TaxID=3109031 RepID=UPI003006E79F